MAPSAVSRRVAPSICAQCLARAELWRSGVRRNYRTGLLAGLQTRTSDPANSRIESRRSYSKTREHDDAGVKDRARQTHPSNPAATETGTGTAVPLRYLGGPSDQSAGAAGSSPQAPENLEEIRLAIARGRPSYSVKRSKMEWISKAAETGKVEALQPLLNATSESKIRFYDHLGIASTSPQTSRTRSPASFQSANAPKPRPEWPRQQLYIRDGPNEPLVARIGFNESNSTQANVERSRRPFQIHRAKLRHPSSPQHLEALKQKKLKNLITTWKRSNKDRILEADQPPAKDIRYYTREPRDGSLYRHRTSVRFDAPDGESPSSQTPRVLEKTHDDRKADVRTNTTDTLQKYGASTPKVPSTASSGTRKFHTIAVSPQPTVSRLHIRKFQTLRRLSRVGSMNAFPKAGDLRPPKDIEQPPASDMASDLQELSLEDPSRLHHYVDATPPTQGQLQYANTFFCKNPPRYLFSTKLFRTYPISSGLPEVVFLGRSNVGKSSVLNALLHVKDLLRTGKMAGTTKSLNGYGIGSVDFSKRSVEGGKQFWHISREVGPNPGILLVDTPGYGVHDLDDLGTQITRYLTKRKELRMAFVLVAARDGIREADRRLLKLLRDHGVPHQIVLTKADQLLWSKQPRDGTPSSKLSGDRLKQGLEKLQNHTQKKTLDHLWPRNTTKADRESFKTFGEIVSTSANIVMPNKSRLGIDALRWAVLRASGVDVDAQGRKKEMEFTIIP